MNLKVFHKSGIMWFNKNVIIRTWSNLMDYVFAIFICTMSNKLVDIRSPQLIMVINVNYRTAEGFHFFFNCKIGFVIISHF